ncbi:ABC transporter substrate-binding protein [Nocardia bovistercoris]|uniref:ABC transporter substrate-binding protein n=1 Tax=Nocardia bovistercoris TaxID=2785916 RepID=A0A931IBT8_9NOCA|nr:ABC transporter substrate-binding protein [Nocardia bovistercoris]MBH0777628.1 ABC transporter substrate-binding protein [Nocardia bovistercoris]
MKPVRRSRVWARAATALLAGALAIGLSGCGSSDDDTASGGEAVTITHARGTTVVEGTPTKIVALGNQWLDATLALGNTPIGYIDNVAVLSNSSAPWTPESLKSAKALSTAGDIAEQVAGLQPDLILVDTFLADQATYDKLSKIAPTLPGLSKDPVADWREQLTTLGKVLHKEDVATTTISNVDRKLETISQTYPGLKGKTFASTWLVSPTQLMVLANPTDPSSKLFTQLGMTIPANLIDQASNQGRVSLSPERADQLTPDLLLAGYSNGLDQTYRQLPGFADLPSVKKGSAVLLTVQEISAVNQPTALSVPYLLEKLGPAFAAASK